KLVMRFLGNAGEFKSPLVRGHLPENGNAVEVPGFAVIAHRWPQRPCLPIPSPGHNGAWRGISARKSPRLDQWSRFPRSTSATATVPQSFACEMTCPSRSKMAEGIQLLETSL